MTIRFGPGGLGGVKEAVANLEEYHKLGIKACEIEFTYGVYIRENDPEVEKIRETAKKLDIKLSIHAPYYINLNSNEKKKIEDSKKRILDCCRVGEKLGCYVVVFHPGFYGKLDKETTYENIKKAVEEIQTELRKEKLKIKIAPETTGKINVFGSVDEIFRLMKETNCFLTVDFAHLLAREQGKISYKEIYEKFKHLPELHCHFSGIEWTSKGERNHKITSEIELRKLLEVLPRNKDIVIINESPSPVEDSVKALTIWKKI